MAEKETKPNGGGNNPPPPNSDPDEEFFSAEGVTDPDERNAIRARARVLAYHEWRKDKAEKEAKEKGKKTKGKPWYQND
jgi:hypothetical protein